MRITKDDYDKKLKQLKDRQYNLGLQLEERTRADENYAITANTVLNLAKNAKRLFESSEVPEKRQILGSLLQNCRLVGKQFLFDLQKPFDSIAVAARKAALSERKGLPVLADSPIWLRD
ncbi:MAG: hypothetical protein ABIJ46_01805 [bacterium]